MRDRIPYTYRIFHVPTNKSYYGSRFAKGCKPEDLWNSYFTSSSIIKDLIKEYGKDSFTYEIRKTFTCPIKCQQYENTVLKRLGVPYNKNWINRHYGHVYHHECQSKGGKSLSQKRSIDPELDAKLKKSSGKGGITASLKKHTDEYKHKRSEAGKIGGKLGNKDHARKMFQEFGKKTKGTKWMYHADTNKYSRISLDKTNEYLQKGWIFKFKEPWNKGLKKIMG